MPNVVPPGTRVRYMGKITALRGEVMMVVYKKVCSCPKDMYVLERDNGKRLENVVRDSFVIVT